MLLALSTSAWSQTTSTNTGSTGGANSGPGTTGVSIRNLPATGSNTSPTATQPSDTRPLFLSGRVMMEDGTPLPQSVTIQRNCYGIVRSVAYTSAGGSFGFQWNNTPGIIQDASEGGGRTMGQMTGLSSAGISASPNSTSNPRSTTGCELRASLAGFRSDAINLSNRTSLDNSDVGVIVLHRQTAVNGYSVSASALQAPKAAKKAYEQGVQALAKNQTDPAARAFEKAVAIYPNYADAWLSLGKIRRSQGQTEPARKALLKAVEADPKLMAPLLELGFLSAAQNDWDGARGYLERAVKLEPSGYPIAWYTLAVANYNLGNRDEAEKDARRAAKLDVKNGIPRERYLLGLILEEKKDLAGAAAEFEAYLKLAPNEVDGPQVLAEIQQIRKILGDATQAAK